MVVVTEAGGRKQEVCGGRRRVVLVVCVATGVCTFRDDRGKFKEGSRKVQGRFKEGSWKVHGRFMEGSWKVHGSDALPGIVFLDEAIDEWRVHPARANACTRVAGTGGRPPAIERGRPIRIARAHNCTGCPA